jgi:hypothetical protein
MDQGIDDGEAVNKYGVGPYSAKEMERVVLNVNVYVRAELYGVNL